MNNIDAVAMMREIRDDLSRKMQGMTCCVLLGLTLSPGAWAVESPRVVASILPVHSLVAGVMAGVGEPTLIVRGYGSPHTYRMRPSDAVKLYSADLVFRVGLSLETFLRKPLSSLPDTARVVSLMEIEGLTLLPNRSGASWEHSHAEEMDSHERLVETGRQRDLRYNPHIWLDPENAGQIVKAIARRLTRVDPVHASLYERNAKALLRRMDDLAGRLRARLSGLAGAPYLVFHDAYPYLAARYNLRAAGAVTASPDRMPSAQRIADLRRTIERLNIRCIFREPQFDAPLIDAALGDMGVTIGVLDPLGVDLRPGPDLWFEVMENLARGMVDCLSE